MRMALGTALVFCLMAAGCGGPDANEQPLPDPTSSVSAMATSVIEELEKPLATQTSSPTIELDYGALDDRTNPERLLHYFADAVRKTAWEEAARAWSSDADITPEQLKAAFTGRSKVELVFGKGDIQSAAGTSFYVAPLVVDFADKADADLRGTIVLRRATDVPGASTQQLNWRIERSDVMQTIRK